MKAIQLTKKVGRLYPSRVFIDDGGHRNYYNKDGSFTITDTDGQKNILKQSLFKAFHRKCFCDGY